MISENSFKDPFGGIIQITDNKIIRYVNPLNSNKFATFYNSKLYQVLIEKEFILPIENINKDSKGIYFECDKIEYITYPYEWTFNQLKDAALLTLKIQKLALKNGFSLKDATPFNIVFKGYKPYFVDYFSFEENDEKNHWVGFEQFLKMFYLPLALKQYFNINFSKHLITHIDGLNLKDYSKLFPLKSFFNYYHLINILLPYRILGNNKKKIDTKSANFNLSKQIKLTEFLFDSISHIKQKKQLTTWNDYYNKTILENQYLKLKDTIIDTWLHDYKDFNRLAIDFGTNNGYFAKNLNVFFKNVIAMDIDYDSIDDLYISLKKEKNKNIQALQVELHNPTPSIGWNLLERTSLKVRFKCDFAAALAVTHHLRITNNVPFELQAKFFSECTKYLLVEYVDKKDPKVIILLSQKTDVYPTYSIEEFKSSFEKYFNILKEEQIGKFDRTIFLMCKK